MYTSYIHRILDAFLGIAHQGMRCYSRYAPVRILFALLLMVLEKRLTSTDGIKVAVVSLGHRSSNR